MKKWIILCLGLLGLATTAAVATAAADIDRPIQISQLPDAAQQFIKTWFGEEKVALVEEEMGWTSNYEVTFTSGSKVEFDNKGGWTEVSCRHSEVPNQIVPAQIRRYVDENYTGQHIVGIERDRRGYEIRLSNGLELTFNEKYRLVDIDD